MIHENRKLNLKNMKVRNWNNWILMTLLLSVVSLFVEQSDRAGTATLVFTNLIDFIIFAILILEMVTGYINAPYKWIYIRKNWGSLTFSLVFIALFSVTKVATVQGLISDADMNVSSGVAIRNFFLVLKVFSRYRRIATIIESLRIHPAMTLLLSFFIVILAGTWLLMMPFTARTGSGLAFLNALFTATSAVCVTGLVVVDTAVYFSIWGQIIILLLIQIGGLGIMVLSYFTLFLLRRKVSVEQKNLVSYMLSEDDMSNLSRVLKSIIIIALSIELIGTALLTVGFRDIGGSWAERLLFSGFHAVSAFCNAGFALFSDSLSGYSHSPLVLGTIAVLIILGGLSFAVIVNIKDTIFHRAKITLNTRIVIIGSCILILSGMVLIYPLEHSGAMKGLGLGEQYLAAFFQSVTLRTAGFNSIPFHSLTSTTLVVMIAIMFIGGASGSTAGGLKVNTAMVLLASVRSAWRNDENVIIRSQTVNPSAVSRAFLILLFGVISVFTGTFFLSLSEGLALQDLVFEAVSAFATVGLSTGITGLLSPIGQVVIIILMFIGRLGPLTVLSATSSDRHSLHITYPQANIAIG